MATVFGYTRALYGEQQSGLAAHQQPAETVRAERFPDLTWGGWFLDAASSRNVPFVDRPAAGELNRRAQRGDHIIIPSMVRAFRDLPDFLLMVELWKDRGITCHLLDADLDTSADQGKLKVLDFAAKVERERRGERTRETLARRKTRGKVCNGFPGYGFKLVGPRGKRRRVIDKAERRIMAYIARHHLEGFTWDAIYYHFLENGIRTRTGKEWSQQRIRRACVAELRRRADEEAEKLGSRK